MKKFLVTLFAAVFTVSCSSSDDGTSDGQATLLPMSANIDAQLYGMEPVGGGNLSDPSGAMFGSDYHSLEGHKLINIVGGATSRQPSVPYDYYIRLAIPKIDVSVGTHTFTNTHIPNGYFADLEITSETAGDGDNEVIFSGKIIVTSWDTATQRLQGTFEFKTNNGITSAETHVVSGSFNYILAE